MDTVTSSQPTDRSKSIEELEGIAWALPSLSSYIVRTTFALRRKPLRDLTNEDVRVGLEQQAGINYLVPLAIERLENDPLVESRLYPGDLLQSLLDVPFGYWSVRPDMQRKTARIATAGLDQAKACSTSWQAEILPGIREAHDRFTGKLKSRVWLRPDEGKAPPL